MRSLGRVATLKALFNAKPFRGHPAQMSTQTLSRITMETMANYRAAATQVVAASAAGSRRLVRVMDNTVRSQVVPTAAKLAPKAGERIDTVRGDVSRLAEQGIEQFAARAEQTIVRSSELATAQVSKWSDLASDVGNAYVAQGLDAAARLTLPAAQLALAVSGKVAQGATQLADVAGAHPVAKPVRRAARKAAATAKKATAPVKKAVRRSRKAAA